MYWYTGQLINSNKIELPINDPALLYGATIFTTMRTYQNNLNHPHTNWKSHQKRLQTSLETLDWPQPDWQQIEKGLQTLIPHWPVLRITIFADKRELITGRQIPPDLENRATKGITAWLSQNPNHSRTLPNHKTGNYLSAWLALQTAQKNNASEAILTDSQGNWLETSTGNLWGWKNNQWHTPPDTAGILPGVAKQQLLNWLKMPPDTQPWTPELVCQFETLAYTNCVVELIPIHTVLTPTGPLSYNPQHPATHALKKYWLGS
ncbi:aminotransferase class IV [Ancylothrix sp. C2]|uniref:aminotransferase class IV n=1 Tax=Ancylothrix sp. D3o TaxID=2953691 RepID=UPI0021BA3CAB|nr:aminotransferase class IV [Ancylothrix sp. D3o]MCT7948836.1 aminotransferase class IV [Ancylothrix sp. D3o]